MINALLNINVNQVEQFFDNWRFDEDGNRLATDFAPYQTDAGDGTPGSGTPAIDVYDDRDFYVNLTAQGHWKDAVQGPNSFQLLNVFVADKTELDWTDPADPDPGTVLTVVHYIRETFPGAIQVLDCFKRDSVRHGQTLIPAVLDEDGNEITPEQITGQPTYPPIPKAEMLEYMPDDVTYDQDGNETGRTPATDYKPVNKTLGWTDRRYE